MLNTRGVTVIVPVVTALGGIVMSVRHGIGMASDWTEVTIVPWSLRSQCDVSVLVMIDMLGWARPLPIPSRGRDGGEVVRLSSVVWLRYEGGVVADPCLIVRPGLLGLTEPRSFGLSLAGVLQAAWPAN
jgi:hypothetical protein